MTLSDDRAFISKRVRQRHQLLHYVLNNASEHGRVT